MSILLVGNDIVDLTQMDAIDKATDTRFVNRVFTVAERRRIAESPTPSNLLWTLWAAKEAAFKVVQKLRPDVIFAHRKFEVGSEFVRFEELVLPVRWTHDPCYVHGLCLGPETSSRSTPWDDVSFVIERVPLGVSESHHVRVLAAGLLSRAGFSNCEIVRPLRGNRSGPPIVVSLGAPVSGVELSLSHDGGFAAAAQLKHSIL